MKVINIQFTLFIALCLSGCGSLPNTGIIQETGFFYVAPNSKFVENCKTIKNKDFNLDSNKKLLLVNSNYMLNRSYIKSKTEKINYFERVLTIEEFEKEIIKENKQDETGIITYDSDMNKIYKNYKPFLFLFFYYNKEKESIQLRLINPDTSEEIFVSDIPYKYSTFNPVHEDDIPNPLFNELIKYIRKNSYSIKK